MRLLILSILLWIAWGDRLPRERQREPVRKVKPCIAIQKCSMDECRPARPPECR